MLLRFRDEAHANFRRHVERKPVKRVVRQADADLREENRAKWSANKSSILAREQRGERGDVDAKSRKPELSGNS